MFLQMQTSLQTNLFMQNGENKKGLFHIPKVYNIGQVMLYTTEHPHE